MHTKAYAAHNATSPLVPFEFDRREPTSHDVEFEILFCGVCHTDVHRVKDDWNSTKYPVVPGHEIVGRVTRIGDKVTKHKVGNIIGVGCLVNSCRTCNACKDGLQQYCENGNVGTYNSIDPIDGEVTKGGYSQYGIANEDFVLAIPKNLDPAEAAPLLCAGITVYSPLRHWDVKPGTKVGVVGVGGLGHMAIKYAKALGAEVTAITTSASKANDARRYGADNVIISTNLEVLEAHKSSLDLIISTIPVSHNIQPYIDLLRRDSTLVLVGALSPIEGFNGKSLITKRRSISGSIIGGIPETQEMLEFSSQHNIKPEIRLIPIEQVNDAFNRIQNKDLSHRFVVDLKASFQ